LKVFTLHIFSPVRSEIRVLIKMVWLLLTFWHFQAFRDPHLPGSTNHKAISGSQAGVELVTCGLHSAGNLKEHDLPCDKTLQGFA